MFKALRTKFYNHKRIGLRILLLVGAAPNAIAYDSKQFTTGEFFLYGIPASIILMIATGFAVFFLWPLMGMPVGV